MTQGMSPHRPLTDRILAADNILRAAFAAGGALEGLFLGLRITGVACWSWWLVVSPALALAAVFAGAAGLVLSWVWACNRAGREP